MKPFSNHPILSNLLVHSVVFSQIRSLVFSLPAVCPLAGRLVTQSAGWSVGDASFFDDFWTILQQRIEPAWWLNLLLSTLSCSILIHFLHEFFHLFESVCLSIRPSVGPLYPFENAPRRIIRVLNSFRVPTSAKMKGLSCIQNILRALYFLLELYS